MESIEKQEIVELEVCNNDIIMQAENQQIETQNDVDDTNVIIKQISGQVKMIEEKRKTFTQPLNQSLKEINKTFKELTKPLLDVKNILSQKVMAWRRKEQEKIREEEQRIAKEEERRRKIQEAHKAKGHEVSEPVVMKRPDTLKETDTTQTRKVWKFEITDPTRVPREYMTINEAKIRNVVRSGIREIPGVRIYQEEIMVVN